MRLPLNKTHYATVIWRGAFILCFVCVIRTESHTFQACLKLNKFDCSETAVLTATCTNMACSARQKLLPSTSDLCHVVSIWPLRSLGRHTRSFSTRCIAYFGTFFLRCGLPTEDFARWDILKQPGLWIFSDHFLAVNTLKIFGRWLHESAWKHFLTISDRGGSACQAGSSEWTWCRTHLRFASFYGGAYSKLKTIFAFDFACEGV